MSEVVRIQTTIDDMDLAKETLLKLQAQGQLQHWMTAEQYTQRYACLPVATSYYAQSGRATGNDRQNALLARNGEPLGIVVFTECADLAGFAAQASEHGPVGQLIGGVHYENTAEGEQSSYEKRVQAEINETFKPAYNKALIDRVAKTCQQRYGATVTQTSPNEVRIVLVGATSLPRM